MKRNFVATAILATNADFLKAIKKGVMVVVNEGTLKKPMYYIGQVSKKTREGNIEVDFADGDFGVYKPTRSLVGMVGLASQAVQGKGLIPAYKKNIPVDKINKYLETPIGAPKPQRPVKDNTVVEPKPADGKQKIKVPKTFSGLDTLERETLLELATTGNTKVIRIPKEEAESTKGFVQMGDLLAAFLKANNIKVTRTLKMKANGYGDEFLKLEPTEMLKLLPIVGTEYDVSDTLAKFKRAGMGAPQLKGNSLSELFDKIRWPAVFRKKLTDSTGNLVSFQLGHLNETEVAELEALFEKTTPLKTMTAFFSSVIPNSKGYKEVGDFYGYPVYSFKVGSDTFYLSYDEDISTHFFSENPVLNTNILEGLTGEKVPNRSSNGSNSAGLQAKVKEKLVKQGSNASAGSKLLATLKAKTPADVGKKVGAYPLLEKTFNTLIEIEKAYPTENSIEHQSMVKKLNALLNRFIKAPRDKASLYLQKQLTEQATLALQAVRKLAKDWARSGK